MATMARITINTEDMITTFRFLNEATSLNPYLYGLYTRLV